VEMKRKVVSLSAANVKTGGREKLA